MSVIHIRNIITNIHGGTIEFKSQIGLGATFIILLPTKDNLTIRRPSETPYLTLSQIGSYV